ncbi:MAG: hypothetical protein OXK82_12855 [Deltaproteobacteria bacterium]|nr:hypothetical protein [Deltaproteobacteria bacterium]
MNWQEFIDLARRLVSAPWADGLHQTQLRLAVGAAYYAMYHALTRSNADLRSFVGDSSWERTLPEWQRVYMALVGDDAWRRMRADFSAHPENIRRFVNVFLGVHERCLLAEEDPTAVFSPAEVQEWVQRAEGAIMACWSVEPAHRRAFALRVLLERPTTD